MGRTISRMLEIIYVSKNLSVQETQAWEISFELGLLIYFDFIEVCVS